MTRPVLAGAVVTYELGLWYANRDNTEPPNEESGAWSLLARSIPKPDHPGQILLSTDQGYFEAVDQSDLGGGGGVGPAGPAGPAGPPGPAGPAGPPGDGSGSLLGSYRGDWAPQSGVPAGYAPVGVIDFEDGQVPSFLRTAGVYGGYAAGDWGTGAEGSTVALLYVSSPGDNSYLELDVESTGDAQIDVMLAWGLNTDGTARILLDGVELESAIGSDGTSGTYTHHLIPVTAGTHTLHIETTGGESGGQNVVAVDSIAVTGSTPTGYDAGWNPGSAGTAVTFGAGDLVRYGGDLWLARAATDNSAPPADGATWARLSTHSTGGGSDLPDPGPDGNLLTAQSSTWISAPPAGDDAPDLTLIFENGLI